MNITSLIVEFLWVISFIYLLWMTSVNLRLGAYGIYERWRGNWDEVFLISQRIIDTNVKMIPVGCVAIVVLLVLS